MAEGGPRRQNIPGQVFGNAEYANILFVYGVCNGDSAAAQEYHRRFPNRRQPHMSVFADTHRKIRETGRVQ